MDTAYTVEPLLLLTPSLRTGGVAVGHLTTVYRGVAVGHLTTVYFIPKALFRSLGASLVPKPCGQGTSMRLTQLHTWDPLPWDGGYEYSCSEAH